MSETLPAHRLHPLSWIFHALRAPREIAFLVLVFMLAGRKAVLLPLITGTVVAVAVIGWGVIRSRSFRYELLERELLVREGLFVRETRHVPFTRIQAVNERQGLLHRLLGVTELELESGSAGRPEAVMRVLGTAEAAHIAAVLRSASPGEGIASGDLASGEPATAAQHEEPVQRLLQVPTGELVIHGIISNRGLLVVAFAAGIIAQNSDLLELLPIGGLLDRIDLGRLVESGSETAAGFSAGAMIGALLVLLLGLLVFVRLLSVAYAVVTLHGFTLQRSSDRLRVTRGLLSRVDVSGRVSGLQRLVLKQSLLHRLFDRCALEVDLAGSSLFDGEHEAKSARLDTLAPIATPAEAQALLDEFVPGVGLDALDWRPLHRSAALRRWQRSMYWLLPLLVAALAGAWLMPGASMTTLGLVAACATAALAASVWHARRWARWSAFAVAGGVVVWRSGVLARRWVVVFDDRAQSTTLRRSPRDRR
ncbi:MAG: PH domain-containing protein, partial [Gammaproteobacteria bacterium]